MVAGHNPDLHSQSAGLIDLQVNGYAGVDFNDAALTPDALDHALHAMLQRGVATCVPTVITEPEADMAARLHALDEAVANSRLGRLMVPGFHLEGPFLNPAPGFAGCHPVGAMLDPDPAVVDRLIAGLRRPVLLLTLAAERPGAEALMHWLAGRGVVVAIGHSDAGADVVLRAVAAGARMSTHLGNGLPQLLPKLANPIMAQLAEDGLAASFIADGIHVPVPALRAMIRAKGPGRAILVTDAVAAADAAPGRYRFAGMAIEAAADGSVRLPGAGTLAGSALTLDAAVRNVVAWGIVGHAEAIGMASTAPAAVLALALEAHGLALPDSEVTWTGLHVASCRVGDVRVGGGRPEA